MKGLDSKSSELYLTHLQGLQPAAQVQEACLDSQSILRKHPTLHPPYRGGGVYRFRGFGDYSLIVQKARPS